MIQNFKEDSPSSAVTSPAGFMDEKRTPIVWGFFEN
jgi:hypothetical protein